MTGRGMSELEASLVYTMSPCLKSKEISTSVSWYEVGIGGVGNWGKRTIKVAKDTLAMFKVGERCGQWFQQGVTGQLAGAETGLSGLFWSSPHGKGCRE